MLHQRARGRQQEERQTDRADQKFRNHPRGVAGSLRAPALCVTNGSRSDVSHHNHENGGKCQKSGMHNDLLAKRKPRGKSMRIGVPGEKKQLEDKYADRPNRRRATEEGEHFLSKQQLNLEEEKRTHEDRESERQPSRLALGRGKRKRNGSRDRAVLRRGKWGFDRRAHAEPV